MGKNAHLILICLSCFFLSLCLFSHPLHGQSSATSGQPFLYGYPPKVYDDHPQNWSVVQDDRGMMYIGNSTGILEFDGHSWRKMPPSGVIRALHKDSTGRIYTGTHNDIGYLEPDPHGKTEFHSLRSKVPEDKRDFGDFGSILSTPQGIYFTTQDRLFRWNGTEMKIWETQIIGLRKVKNRILCVQRGIGLVEIRNDSLITLPDGAKLANANYVYILPYDEKQLFITSESAFFLYDEKTLHPFETAGTQLIISAKYTRAEMLDNGTYIFATTQDGIFSMNKQGQIILHLNKSMGMLDNSFSSIFIDREKGLWVTSRNGFVRVEYPAPFSIYDESRGMGSTVYDIIRHQGTLYVASATGVYYFDEQSNGFLLIPGTEGQTTNLFPFEDHILAANVQYGVLEIVNKKVTVIKERTIIPYIFRPTFFLQSKKDPNRIFVGGLKGIFSLYRKENRWIDEGPLIPDVPQQRYLRELNPGELWAGHLAGGATRIIFKEDGTLDNPIVEYYGQKEGLGDDGGIAIFKVRNRLAFAASNGVFRFDEATKTFSRDTLLEKVQFARAAYQYKIIEDNKENIWMNYGKETAVLRKQADGSYLLEKRGLTRFSDNPATEIYPEEDGTVWFGGTETIIKLDPSVEKNYEIPFNTLIRKVVIGEDSLIFEGGTLDKMAAEAPIHHAFNSLHFEFAALTYDYPEETQFQTRLEPFDPAWSAWSKTYQRNYTNLPEGRYTFHVRARNIHGQLGNASDFSFEILPPWHRTWLAYFLYVLAFISIITFAIRNRTKQLRARSEMLEKTVKERTEKVRQQAAQQAALFRLSAGISAASDEESICKAVVEGLQDPALDYAYVALLLVDSRTGERVLKASVGLQEANTGLRLAPGEGLSEKPLSDGRLHYEPDVTKVAEYYLSLGKGSEVDVPIKIGTKTVGVLVVESEKPHSFDQDDFDILQTAASQTGIALGQAWSHMETKQKVVELSTVNQISQAIASQLDTDALIQKVGDLLQKTFNADVVFLALLNEEKNLIEFPYQYGDKMRPIPFGDGLSSKIIITGKPLLINENIADKHLELGIKAVGVSVASFLGVPIRVGDQAIGVISVQSTKDEGRFDEEDLRLLNTIASNVGISMHNARLFEQTVEARAIAEEANETKSSFLSTVSHELRTPLTSVLGFAKIVRKRLTEKLFVLIKGEDTRIQKTKEQVIQNLDIMISEGERLTELINNVLDLAKIEAGRFDWNMEKVSIPAIISTARAATTSLFEQKNLQYLEDVPEDLPLIIGDNDKILQVLINLFSNAVKFTDQGSVVCKARQYEDRLVVSVTDTGHGIADTDIDMVFEKFKQVGDTLTDRPKGTGLGLPISKEIIEHHGGQLWVESELGKGSTFFFSLPLIADSETLPTALELDALVKQLKRKMPMSSNFLTAPQDQTILIVDDEASIRELLSQELSEVGYKVLEAENGKKALQMIRKQHPDMIVLDVMMPEMNGFDLAAILKNDPQTMDIPILILSIIKDKDRGLRIGVDRYLTKPIDTGILFREIEQLLTQGKSKKKVMIVDEDESTIKTLSETLQTRGYNVVEANGSDLIKKAISAKPDVIFINSLLHDRENVFKSLRFEKGLENVLLFMYQ